MNIPRIVLTQSMHITAWGALAGRYYLITNEGNARGSAFSRKELGEEFLATIVAERDCILQVKESASMEDAAEKYHNPRSAGYRQLALRQNNGGEQPIYRGPELLLYLHGPNKLATFLLAHPAARGQLDRLKKQFASLTESPSNVTRFGVSGVSAARSRFQTPTMRQTDLRWTDQSAVSPERMDFEAASKKHEPFVPNGVRAAVNQFKRAVKIAGGKVSRDFDRMFNNLIQQANDGDYMTDFIDEALNPSDFH